MLKLLLQSWRKGGSIDYNHFDITEVQILTHTTGNVRVAQMLTSTSITTLGRVTFWLPLSQP